MVIMPTSVDFHSTACTPQTKLQTLLLEHELRNMIKVDCGADALLSGFHFEFSEGGRWARSKCLGRDFIMRPQRMIMI